MAIALSASSRASELPAAHLRCPVRARPGIQNHRTSLSRRLPAACSLTIDSAVWVLAFREDDEKVGSKRRIAAVDHETVGGVIGGGVAHQIHRDAAEVG